MYNDIDLVAIDASAMNKWVCAAMKQIFTKEELKEGYVCGENSTSNYKQIDSTRIELLKEALFIKYKIQKQNQNTVWKEMRKVAGRVCIESRKSLNNNKTIAENNSPLDKSR